MKKSIPYLGWYTIGINFTSTYLIERNFLVLDKDFKTNYSDLYLMKTTVYTITDCPFCKQEKDFLTAQGIQFEEKNVQENRQFLTEMLEVSNKFAGVPFTIVEKDSGEKVSLRGFTQSEFEEALGKTTAAPATSAPAEAPALDVVAAPVIPTLDTQVPDMPKTDMQMGDIPGSTPSSMPDAAPNMPSMPGIDEMPNMSTTPATPVAAPVDPVVAPAPMAPDPVTPAMPADSSAPANPQSQLDGLLADLQTKAQPDIPEFPSQAPQGTATQQQ